MSVKTAIPDGLLWDVIPGDVRVLIGDEQSMSPDELEAETAKMVDYYRSKGERRADWVATWRNWMRSDFRKPRGSPSAPKDRPTQNGRVGYTIDELKRLANGEQVESPGNNATTHDARFRVVQ